LLGKRFRQRAMEGDLHDPPWWPGLLWRIYRREFGHDYLSSHQETALVQVRRRLGSQHCTGVRHWAHRLSDEWLLLRTSLRIALGHSFSARYQNQRRGASHPDL